MTNDEGNTHRFAMQTRFAAAFFLVGLLSGCTSTNKAEAQNAGEAPPAAVVKVVRHNISSDLEIASEFLPFQEIDVYAKVSGYIQKLYIDWGSHVHQGQLLAVLEIPELEQQIQEDRATVERASEDLNRAQSAYNVADVTYRRLADVQKTRPELVAQQDIDVAQGKDLEANASVSSAKQGLAAAQATLSKDQALYSYARMTAPFNGVVTQMYAYTGALLPAGTSSNIGNSALCHLSQNDLLRLVIPAPERAVPDLRIGETVTVEVSGLKRTFDGKIIRVSDQIDLATRTMHTEVQVPNPNYQIVPGMYATVRLPLHTAQDVLVLPVQAVRNAGEERGHVLLVNSENKIEQRDVTLGLQTSDEVEITSGLREGDLVIFGEQSQFKPSELVKPTVVTPSAMEKSF
jgi:RND family efflux transporter MFP subunit